jgi:DNA-binding NtrC family response regulator
MLEQTLARAGYGVATASDAESALTRLEEVRPEVVVTDLKMPGMNGLELCERVAANRPDVPVVVITAFGSLETAIGAVRAGAYDFVTKPFEIEVLVLALQRAVRSHQLHEEVRRLRDVVSKSAEMDGMIGTSPQMQAVFASGHAPADSGRAAPLSGATMAQARAASNPRSPFPSR